MRVASLVLLAVAPIAAQVTFTLDSNTGSGQAASRAASANPPCIQPNCALFLGKLTDSDPSIRLENISVSFPTGLLSLDNTFFAVVPGVLTTGIYVGPLFGIDIAPGTPPGVYSGTVTIQNATQSLTVTVTNPTSQVTGIANAASGATAGVAPGAFVAIYGNALAGSGNPSATSLPLPTTLNGAQFTLCDVPLPLLYASATQINALVPQNLSPGTCQLSVGGVKTAVTITALQPGIYTVNLSGSGPGVIANALTGQLINDANPAHASDFVAIYCTGLGVLQGGGPTDGAAAPISPLYRTVAKVTATIGGVDAPVSFAGLTPTLAGLYQVNVQVPSGVTPASAVPVVLTAGGVPSNTVTLSLR